MKTKHRIFSLLLSLALILSVFPVCSAGARDPLHYVQLDREYLIFPAGDVIDATIVPGETKVLTFVSDIQVGGFTEFYGVQIYRGSIEDLSAQIDRGQEPEPIESHYISAEEFKKTYRMYVNWTADSRYPVGDYCAVCFLIDGTTGELYSDVFDSIPTFWTDLHVVSAREPDRELTVWAIADDGWYEIPEGGFVFPTYHYDTLNLALIPGPTPGINRPNYKIYCSEYDVLSFAMLRGYLELRCHTEGMAKITIIAGNLERNFWVKYGNFNEATDVKIYRDTDTLCVGAQAKCKVRSKQSSYLTQIGADWSSSDPSIATVNNLGIVTALRPGTVQITAEAGAYKESVEFTVNYHQLPEDTPVTVRTATQPKQAAGHCSVCGRDDAVNIYEEAVFTDTVPGAWYAEHVDRVYDLGLMNGTAEHSFSPDSTLTRAMAATVLYRIAGKPEVTGVSPFPDVPAGQWYTDAVIWAQANGIVTGYQDGSFGPNRSITREQFSAILYRYMRTVDPALQPTGSLSGFPDAARVQSYAQEAMRWAVGEGLINGVAANGQTFLRPENNTTRAQFATIISRFMKVLEQYEPEEPAPDPETENPDVPDPETPNPDTPAPPER